MKTNKENLVMLSVKGKVSNPVKGNGYTVTHDGEAVLLPGVGGITYNVKVGDQCMNWVGDHVEPGVSIKLDDKQDSANNALNILACIGNKAYVRSGDAKGKEGYVTGKHGGIEHVLIYFDDETLDQLNIGDDILIKSIGQGLAIDGMADDIKVMNLDPALLDKINPKLENGVLEVPVVAEIPAELMGSGIGAYTAARGDYDLTTADPEVLRQYGLENLRFGDLVALLDTDNSYGRCFRSGAVTIGVVVHSNCVLAGHGPGITTILTSAKGKIAPVKDSKANIAQYLGIRQL